MITGLFTKGREDGREGLDHERTKGREDGREARRARSLDHERTKDHEDGREARRAQRASSRAREALDAGQNAAAPTFPSKTEESLPNNHAHGVLWDMDGVLVDPGDFHYQSWSQILPQYGIDIDRARFQPTFGMNNAGVLGAIARAQAAMR